MSWLLSIPSGRALPWGPRCRRPPSFQGSLPALGRIAVPFMALALAGAPSLVAQELPLGPPASALDAASPAEAEILAVVDRLFDGMRARDGSMVASVFHPDARLISTSSDAEGRPAVAVREIQVFVDAVGQGGDPWNEPYFQPVIQIDGNLAHVWIFYHFYAGDTFSHCGFDSIQMVRMPEEGWRMVSLADTRRTEGCGR
jgi:hypothetical protein